MIGNLWLPLGGNILRRRRVLKRMRKRLRLRCQNQKSWPAAANIYCTFLLFDFDMLAINICLDIIISVGIEMSGPGDTCHRLHIIVIIVIIIII